MLRKLLVIGASLQPHIYGRQAYFAVTLAKSLEINHHGDILRLVLDSSGRGWGGGGEGGGDGGSAKASDSSELRLSQQDDGGASGVAEDKREQIRSATEDETVLAVKISRVPLSGKQVSSISPNLYALIK